MSESLNIGWELKNIMTDQPPKEGTRRYKQVLNRGCGGYSYDTSDGMEYDCYHYDWICDYCPIVIERYKDQFSEKSDK